MDPLLLVRLMEACAHRTLMGVGVMVGVKVLVGGPAGVVGLLLDPQEMKNPAETTRNNALKV